MGGVLPCAYRSVAGGQDRTRVRPAAAALPAPEQEARAGANIFISKRLVCLSTFGVKAIGLPIQARDKQTSTGKAQTRTPFMQAATIVRRAANGGGYREVTLTDPKLPKPTVEGAREGNTTHFFVRCQFLRRETDHL
eukprot:COSAG06_NODE_995_length_11158_cov_10.796184_17_plen_137_part_00